MALRKALIINKDGTKRHKKWKSLVGTSSKLFITLEQGNKTAGRQQRMIY